MAYDKYIAPGFRQRAFTCPLCGICANARWEALYYFLRQKAVRTGFHIAYCDHCAKPTVWAEDGGKMIWPQNASLAPLPNPDMPSDIQNDYSEARSIAALSPRGAAALLRLCIQKLCKHLGEPGKSINEDIGNLVQKGLPVQIQRALDVVRVIGNNLVHPSQMCSADVPETVSSLFDLVNMIVQDRISEPEEVKRIYENLPQGSLAAIEKRDQQNSG